MCIRDRISPDGPLTRRSPNALQFRTFRRIEARSIAPGPKKQASAVYVGTLEKHWFGRSDRAVLLLDERRYVRVFHRLVKHLNLLSLCTFSVALSFLPSPPQHAYPLLTVWSFVVRTPIHYVRPKWNTFGPYKYIFNYWGTT